MADEYIKREAAKALLRQHEHRFTCADEANGYGNVKWSEYVVYSDTAQNCIDAIPAADVAPVRHGRWQITDAYPHNVYCSECHTRFAQTHWAVWEDGSLPRAYCPNCGSKMDKEVDT